MTLEQLQVRAYREADLSDVVNLWKTVFPEDPPWNDPRTVIRRKLGVRRDLFLVGHSNGQLVATVIAGFDGFRGWVYHLAVAPGRRRRGLGRKIMAAAESRLRAVRASNEEVIEFYQTLGYMIEERTSMSKRLE